MELRKLKEEKDSLLVELVNETKSFSNLIREELWNDENISEAAAIKEHPYMAEPKVFVKMKGKSNPKVALERAAKRLEVKIKDLKTGFEQELRS